MWLHNTIYFLGSIDVNSEIPSPFVPLTPEYSNNTGLLREPVLFRRRISFSEDSGESQGSDFSGSSIRTEGGQNLDLSPEI